MRYLTPRSEDPKEIFLLCVSAIQDNDLKNRLSRCAGAVELAAKEYEIKKRGNELHTISRNKSTKANKNLHVLDGNVTINEMKNVYTSYFVPKDMPGRELYDKVLSQPMNNKCPYCFHRQVSTVDHYLPKAYYPFLSVVPLNLVASCKDCNTGKSGAFPQKASDEILHPYFDNVEDDLWLKAEVNRSSPASLTFFVDPPSTWDKLLQDRVIYHFDSLQLNTLYGSEAATELNNIRFQLHEQFSIGGESAVRLHLEGAARSRQNAYTNSWQTAMYIAISNCDWFCNGGFRD